MKRIMLVFGTRPEAIKMCPLARELGAREGIETTVCVSGQHRELLYPTLELFGVTPDFDLAVMKEGQTLSGVTAAVLSGLERVLDIAAPDAVLVHGDTTTALATALACFYKKIPVCHVEAGLRTQDLYSPYPEEFNRRVISIIAKYHFAPTDSARENLIREGIDGERVFVTGNTGIDALRYTVRADYSHPLLDSIRGRRLVMITAHRRESSGEILRGMLSGIRRAMDGTEDAVAVYPVHPSPTVRAAAEEILGGCDRVILTEAMDVTDFHNFLARSYLVLTDSGGIQEEAAFLGIPTLVMRQNTERPEGERAGTLKTVGTDAESVCRNFKRLLENADERRAMAHPTHVYGEGNASSVIAHILEGVICS